jgi:hypothetical protein
VRPTSYSAPRSAAHRICLFALAAVIAGVSSGWAADTSVVTPTPPTLRRNVALVLSIDANTYRDKLDQAAACGSNCTALETALVDPVRTLFARKFAFADWRKSSTPPADTVEVHWVEMPPPATPGSWVEFRLVGAGRPRADSLRVDFEPFSVMVDRSDWRVAPVREQWIRRLTTILERADLVPLLFGRIPVNVPVKFTSVPRVKVPLSGTDIGAAADSRPAFRVVAQVTDPGPPASSDVADVILTGCVGLASFVCDITELRYPGGKVVTGAPLAALLARGTLKTQTVHLLNYSAGVSALVAPGGTQ